MNVMQRKSFNVACYSNFLIIGTKVKKSKAMLTFI